MAFKPNYRMQRADRNRAAQARSEQKQRKRDEKSAQRKAERASEISSLAIRRHNEERGVTAAESKGLKKGSRVFWRGDAADGGSVAEMSWDAVTIAWDNGELAPYTMGTCAKSSVRR